MGEVPYSTAPKLGALEDGLRDNLRVGPDPVAPLSVRQHWLSQIGFQFGEAKKLQVAAGEPAMSRYFELSSRRRAADGVQLAAPPQRSSVWGRWTQAHGTLLIGRGLPSTPLSLQPPLPPDFITNISLQALTFAKPCNAGHRAGQSSIAAASRINGCRGGRGKRRQCAVAREVGSRIGWTGCGG